MKTLIFFLGLFLVKGNFKAHRNVLMSSVAFVRLILKTRSQNIRKWNNTWIMNPYFDSYIRRAENFLISCISPPKKLSISQNTRGIVITSNKLDFIFQRNKADQSQLLKWAVTYLSKLFVCRRPLKPSRGWLNGTTPSTVPAAAAVSCTAPLHCELSGEGLRDLKYSHDTEPIRDNNAVLRQSSAVYRP